MAETEKGKRTSSRTTAKSSASGGARTTKRKKKADGSPEFIRSEVLLIASFAVAILLFLSNFHLCGSVGDILRGAQLGLLGVMGFLFPVLMFAGVCFYVSNRGNRAAMLKLGAAVLAVFVLCGLIQMMFGLSLEQGRKITEFYTASSKAGTGGGLLGGLLASLLHSAVGTVGAYLVLLVLAAICAVCITERSLVSAVKKGGGKAYRYAREDMDRRSKIHAQRQEERRLAREEQKVHGVNLGATKIEAVPNYWDDKTLDELNDSLESAASLAEKDELADCLYREDDKLSFDVAEGFHSEIKPPDLHDDFDDDSVPFDEPDAVLDVFEEGGDSIYQEDGELYASDGEKRVVTASGKVIETDTQLLQKKLEQKRTQATEDGDLSVSYEIAERQKRVKREYQYPPVTLLKRGGKNSAPSSDREFRETAVKLQQTLKNFGVGVTITNISCGPSVTRYELHPEQGVKVSKIVGLTDDIKLSLAAADIRIEAPIPGKSAVGIEVPNKENNMVLLRELLDSEAFKKHPSKLAFAVGKDIGGQVVVTDIAKMPHLLIAGATGSGKSVCINTIIMSVIYKASPDDVKLIMVDPKVVELSVYNGIPHLLIPVVTDPKKASGALNWAVAEMTDRYKKFADYNVRDLKGYNEKVESLPTINGEARLSRLPQIVIIIDELADLMMVAPGEVEDSICRLAQLARAAGIHLVIATQRPSVNVITGLIKANVPSRIAFAVSSGVDSRTIIDMNGAEKLLGKGDMLFYPAGYPKPQRVQGAFVSDGEVQKVVDFLKAQGLENEYSPEVEERIEAIPQEREAEAADGRDDYFNQAGRFIIEKEKASIGMLQRMFKIGFNRAARIMDQLAEAGVVGPEEGTKPRKVLMTMEEFDEMIHSKLS